MNLIKKFLAKDVENKININVIGDPMIDEYYDVNVSRISPEFPIPIYKSSSHNTETGLVPGGAANVAYQFKHFNVDLEFVCLLTNLSKSVFNSKGIKTNYSKVVDNMFMPVKKRIYSQEIPLSRWDFEKENFGLDDIKKHLFELEIPNSDLNIFSDYNKGMFSTPWFRKYFKNAKSIVDPKNANIDLWQDCTVFKPNSVEAREFSEKKNWKDQIEFFTNSIKCDSVVITQGGNGVVGKDNDYFEYRPTEIVPKPESVIGAGDCFVCFLAMALVRGFSLSEAAEIACLAGSYYVRRKMNRPISPAELLTLSGSKLVANPFILTKRNFDLVFTNGCFDFGLTAAHVDLFKFAKKQGDKLVVALNSDASTTRLKGDGRPILPLEERMKIVSSNENVDYVISFDEDTPIDLLKKIMPTSIVKGGDYKKEQVVGNELFKVILFDYQNVMSTTQKIKKINEITTFFIK